LAELPEDVKQFIEELKSRGINPGIVAVQRTPPPNETYHVFKNGEYLGVRPAVDVLKERMLVVCGKRTCVAFDHEDIKLILDRTRRKILNPS